ncbi:MULTISPECIES: hypothetical protein [Actinosynnema]|uniref:hypothetical protein n=1 Tax=Actinosynnema TaxID=40566 RepID=UPI0020A52BFE|nr:hypothetical protein [Actinosynnema pretiosum]
MRTLKLSAATGLAVLLGAGLAGGVALAQPSSTAPAATPSSTAPAATPSSTPAATPSSTPAPTGYSVTPWLSANIRECPYTSCEVVGRTTVEQALPAYCWTHGQTITDYGITNDVWVAVGFGPSGRRHYVSAVYLSGDERGNLPAHLTCGPILVPPVPSASPTPTRGTVVLPTPSSVPRAEPAPSSSAQPQQVPASSIQPEPAQSSVPQAEPAPSSSVQPEPAPSSTAPAN